MDNTAAGSFESTYIFYVCIYISNILHLMEFFHASFTRSIVLMSTDSPTDILRWF